MSAVRACYPTDREADVVLRDGSTVHVRPVRAGDAAAIADFLGGLSRDSIAFRFFGAPNMKWVISWSVDVDYADRFALVAETGSPSQIISHAAYVRTNHGQAEVAFLVADAWQGRGISTIMLAHLASVASDHGIATFRAEVLPANHRMIAVLRQSGFPLRTRSTRDAVEVEFPTSLSRAAIARFDERERTAAVAAVRHFLAPRTVAVIGASRRHGTVGGAVLHNLISGGYTGAIYAVNPSADVVQGLPAHASVSDIPAPVDLAVVVVAAKQVVGVARECAAAGVRALLVISAGFAETGAEGERRQRELVRVCRGSGMRLIGPNCVGVVNTAPDISLNATFAPGQATPGRVGFLSQSGGAGVAVLEAAGRLGVGLSSFVSVGNKADLSGNDFLEYWEQDPDTDVALLYLESFGNPRKFAHIARRVARRKPVVAVKSGRSAAGARATSSHTGALLSASDVTVDALFHQAGVIRTDTLHELFDVAALLAKQPVPKADRIAIVTNAGGPGIVCADACRANGVQVPELPAAVRGELRHALPHAASVCNPVDLIASARAADYATAMRALIAADACDAIVAIFVPPLVTKAHDVASAIAEVARDAADCTLAAVFMTREGTPAELADVPGFPFPEDAARAIALAARHGVWRAGPEGRYPEPGCRPDEAAAIISEELAAGRGWLSPGRARALLSCYGLPLIAEGPSVQPMAPPAVELIVGVVHDQSFGPVLACGAGGAAAGLIQDVAVRIMPLTDIDAAEMIRSLKTFPLLDGYGGAPRCDIAAIEDVLQRISAMVQAHPEIDELDCNPLVAGPHGATIVGARIRVAASEPPAPVPSVYA
ncbi:MAG TPA: GNAT family N-acetyltransferase [Solirubrobacteraceae bacterium]|nr:GNAT family N-acetyltransferase [Solirubrobacteraceae bacterium]